ncbi:hypothetical protein [Chitinophaga sancti]|uniref:Lipoprotein n=1 Tax=Chitinophaga sancti TaxID=1004 RepID=A0A1K1SVN6_9BACT|nr:hypothetical protein [Chitinophaga sancti]WQD63797.1 hypothetical protein U0033_05265 [Chitinophaga sancti]WQG90578.1 hypothetical protein SR876_03655 [Chitinophaga sancti]SFW88127.1 hypothetical protein SAMN05661012_06197 [Chitinophaga sancti]
MKYLTYLCLVVLLLVHCRQAATREKPVDSVHTVPIDTPEERPDSLLVIPDTAKIEVGKFQKKENLEPGKEEYTFCEKWKLDSATLVRIIRGFKPINGSTWHYSYDSFDCQLVGIIKISGREYRMYLNAGSYFFLTNGDRQFIFGDEKNAFNKYFLEGNIYDQNPKD